MASMQEWFVRLPDGVIKGPLSPTELKGMADEQTINPGTEVQLGLGKNWKKAAEVKGLFSPEAIEEFHREQEIAQRPVLKRNRSDESSDFYGGESNPVELLPVVTTEDYSGPDGTVDQTFPVVTSRRVYGINAFGDLKIAVTNFFGGRSKRAENALADMESEVIEDLCRKAKERGCHALVKLMLHYGTIERSEGVLLYVTATATPVTLRPRTSSEAQ
jgi:uncharacterized protein YbjQ (UPF0145 family)